MFGRFMPTEGKFFEYFNQHADCAVRLLDAELKAEMEARVLVLPPGRTQLVPGRCRGLARGWYREFFVVQRTLFPFGLISKFKVAK